MNKRTGKRSGYEFTSPTERRILEETKDIKGEEYADMILSNMSELDLRGPHLLNGAETDFVLEWSANKNVSIVCMI